MTPAQVLGLRLAAREEIRYYRSGWFSIPAEAGPDGESARQAEIRARAASTSVPSVSGRTIASLVRRGLLACARGADWFEHRWSITEAGRQALGGSET